MVATGWDRFWPDRARYMNEKNGVKHFPGLSAEAADYLARDRRVAGIGIDTPSIDSTTVRPPRSKPITRAWH